MEAVPRPRKIWARVSTLGEYWWFRAAVGTALLGLILLAAIAWLDGTGSLTTQRVAVTFLINLLAVVGLQVFMGNSDIPSFGHVGFVAIGAYVAAIVMTPVALKASPYLIPNAPGFIRDTHLGFVPGLLVALVVVGFIAAITGLAIVRLNGASAAIATLAILMIVQSWVGNWTAVTHGPQTWAGIPQYTTIWVALGVTVIGIFVARCFRESGTGLMLRASRKEELASRAVGVDLTKERFRAWILSALLAGAAGVLWASYFLAISPSDFFFDLTFMYVVMVVLGGTSVTGAVAGAAFVTVVNEFTRRAESSGLHIFGVNVSQLYGLGPIVLSVLVLITLYLRPSGVFGRWELDEVLVRLRRRYVLRRGRGVGRPGEDPLTASMIAKSDTDKTEPKDVLETERRALR